MKDCEDERVIHNNMGSEEEIHEAMAEKDC